MTDYSEYGIILRLLKAELRNRKLIHGLTQAGMLVADFHTDLVR